MELQSVRDFVSTYTWIFVFTFIAIIGASTAILVQQSAVVIHNSCTIIAGFSCRAAALGSYSGGSELFLRVVNSQKSTVYLSGNVVSVHPYVDNSIYYGSCTPEVVASGDSFLCIVRIGGYSPEYGTAVSPGFTLSYGLCSGQCTTHGASYSVSGTTYITAGQSEQEAANATS